VRKPTVISLFSGAGGLDLGFEAAGFDMVAAVEFDRDCCETLRANRPTWRVIERSIFDVPSAELSRAGDVDVLIGGPPCQPFSKSGYWLRGDVARLNDPRASTLAAYLRVLRDTTPRSFLLENVEGLTYRGKDEALRFLLDAIQGINRTQGTNYQPCIRVLNAADFGVPQLRERVFIVASREGQEFQFPVPTHTATSAPGLESHRTAWDAIGDLVEEVGDEDLAVRGKWAGLLPSIPEGNNYLWHTDRMGGTPLFGWRRRYWSFLLKLAKDRPSWTIQGHPGPAIGPFHWRSRRLSARELCRIQTFPDDYRLTGSRASVQKQAGNAVPSLLAEVLAREIRVQLLGLRKARGELKLALPRRVPVPGPETTRSVPRKYLVLRGKHAPHPGTGQGAGARARRAA